jgi:MYXO-CTERM domain-containing protein
VSCSCRFGEPAERTGLAWAAFALGLVAVARRRRS